MKPIDWGVVAALCAVSMAVGLYFTRRSSAHGVQGYFAGDRNLPWWAIGLSNTATYSSSGSVFIMIVLALGLSGNWVWWSQWVIWMPLVAIVWAPMWRRMRIVTTAELITLRYSGPPARLARRVYALISTSIAVLLLAYITGVMAKAIAPLLEMSDTQSLLLTLVLFGGITMIYTVGGGLTGVVFVDVVQFAFLWGGTMLFMFWAIDQHGGWAHIVQRVAEVRPQGLDPYPGTTSMPWLLLAALALQGLFFAGSPTAGEGFTAQRFMAARNERHALGGQLFNAALALSVRMVPLIGLGIVAMSVFWTQGLVDAGRPAPSGMIVLKEPIQAWAELIRLSELPPSFAGLLVAVELAALMSTLSSVLNWGGSFVMNDFYKSARPLASAREEIWASRTATVGLFILSGIVAWLFVDRAESWFLFINIAMVTVLLPLAWLRFFWWRFNVWGELTLVGLSLPVAICLWFIAGLKDATPIGQGLGLLAVLAISTIVGIAISLVTTAESDDCLGRFYDRCRPPGLWGPVRRRLGLTTPPDMTAARLVPQSLYGILACLGLVVATNAVFVAEWLQFTTGLFGGLLAAALLLRSVLTNRQAESNPAPERVSSIAEPPVTASQGGELRP